ncbi:MAG: DUF6288 domain-containing protein [Planctomycetota bacterium]|jgi:hypothetical protein
MARSATRVALAVGALSLCLPSLVAGPASAQVHYFEDGRPWKQTVRRGPDAEVPGWFLNLGPTGLRAELLPDAPLHLGVRHVFADTPGHGLVRVGDRLIGAGGRDFDAEHQNGYGMEVFGARGPMEQFAAALAGAQASEDKRLSLSLLRGDERLEVSLQLPADSAAFAPTFPTACPKSERLRLALLDYLVAEQGEDGSWGQPIANTFAPLALMASDAEAHRAAVEANVRWQARSTSTQDERHLINWHYMTAAIVLGERYLATGEDWLLPELQEVHDFLAWSQFLRPEQINPKAKESHPHAYPKHALDSHGGWGHNPGFEGYGPIAMLTGQGALAYSLLQRCGIEVDRELHDAAYAFLERGTGRNGYVWYEDAVAGHENWADLGRTGASGIAFQLAPYDDPRYLDRARLHAKMIGAEPASFPDTHGSPLMGMGYTALGAWHDADAFAKLMDANRWWFTTAECAEGTFHYQPNRDNAGYGPDARRTASAVVAFLLSLPQEHLTITRRAGGPRR